MVAKHLIQPVLTFHCRLFSSLLLIGFSHVVYLLRCVLRVNMIHFQNVAVFVTLCIEVVYLRTL